MNLSLSQVPTVQKEEYSEPTIGKISSISPKSISQEHIDNIFNIERDMWAHGLGEYIKCKNCGKVHSKSDVYKDLPRFLQLKTVSDIEKILGYPEIICSQCDGETEYIFDKTYKDTIVERYNFPQSFLSIFQDTRGKICGFFDGYIADVQTIYEREFQYYYGKDAYQIFLQSLQKAGGGERLNGDFLCLSAVGTEQSYGSMFIIYKLLKNFFENLPLDISHIGGIYESVLGGNTHKIYEILGGKRIMMPPSDVFVNTHECKTSDIFFHKNIQTTTSENLGISLKTFLSSNRGFLKNSGKSSSLT